MRLRSIFLSVFDFGLMLSAVGIAVGTLSGFVRLAIIAGLGRKGGCLWAT